jgi:hypothetical protein
MLRSLGIHARVVTGFRGAESKGDGAYVIRQNFAHSWVEALVFHADHWHWRMLDPTPNTAAPPPTPFSWARWWEKTRNKGQTAWKDLILDYESDRQDALLHDTWDWLSKDGGKETAASHGVPLRLLAIVSLSAIAAVPVFWLAYRLWPRGRGRSAARTCDVPFYNRLLALLAGHARLQPQPGQTPREFTDVAGRFLKSSDATAPLADIPARLATLLYRVRYGQQPLSEEEYRSVDAALQRLAAGLAR